jgi:hypothetical protein
LTDREVVTLKEYINVLILNLEKRLDERNRLQEIALDKAAETLRLRLETMNEFRDQINKERGEYITRKELDLILKPLEKHSSFMEGRDWMIATGITFIIAIGALLWAILGG